MHRGYIKLWRKVFDSGLFQLPNAFTMFVYMLTEATHKPIKYGSVNLSRGQLVSGRNKLASDLGLSEQKVRTSLAHLHDLGMITSHSTNKYTVYTIDNYDKYQAEEINQPTDNQQVTNKQPTSNQQITTIQEQKNIRTKEHKQTAARGSRFSADMVLNSDYGNVALETRPDWFNADVVAEFEVFKDYWIAQPGQKGVKTDWMATWRNWCRRSNRRGIAA